MLKKYFFKNLDCANCADKIERAIRKIDGVSQATVSFPTQRLFLEADEEDLERVLSDIQKICKKIDSDCQLIIN